MPVSCEKPLDGSNRCEWEVGTSTSEFSSGFGDTAGAASALGCESILTRYEIGDESTRIAGSAPAESERVEVCIGAGPGLTTGAKLDKRGSDE